MMLAVHDLTFTYDEDLLFECFNWQVEQGETWTILGASGCGKTTLLYLLAGLLQPSDGEILIHDTPLQRPRPRTGLILQDFGLLPWGTIRQNVSLGLKIRAFYGPDGLHAPAEVSADAGQDAVEYWLKRFSLDQVAHHYPSQISGGQRQRAAIARTLVLAPDLLLMDEPFASLDAPTRESLQDLMLELHREHSMTLVAVTHTIEEATVLGRKVLVLGQPPNTQASIFHNPGAGSPDHRASPAYQSACRDLRSMLEQGV
jgi:ABC-type nitrate/sulfonate/bicarbonate transport system ATPase subunit